MEISLKRLTAKMPVDKLVSAVLNPDGQGVRPNQLLKAAGLVGRRDPLTDLQQKLLTAAIALIHIGGRPNPERTEYAMKAADFLALFDSGCEDKYSYLTSEIEKLVKKGIWLYDEKAGGMTRAQWFQAIGFSGQEIIFRFSAPVITLIAAVDPCDVEYRLVKGIQYKGKHTMAVFEIIWAGKDAGVVEYSIPELMKQLSLEHTRYSYGQLKLRVLEPSLQEIYDWDEEIFVRFGPNFSGRRVEGVWFVVKTGEEAREMRKKEPEFRFVQPEDKPV